MPRGTQAHDATVTLSFWPIETWSNWRIPTQTGKEPGIYTDGKPWTRLFFTQHYLNVDETGGRESQNLQETSPGPLLGLGDSVDSRPHHLQGPWQSWASAGLTDSNFPGHGHLRLNGASAEAFTAGVKVMATRALSSDGANLHAPRGLRGFKNIKYGSLIS